MACLMSVHSRCSASASRMAFWATECDHEPGKLHQCGGVHKDIKPANILVNRATGTVKLTGFRNASRLRRERQLPEPPETIADPLSSGSQEPTIWRTRRMLSRASEFASHAPWSATVAMQAPVNFDLFADANSASGVPGRRQANVSTRKLRSIPPHVLGRTMRLLMSTDGN
jgi:serine/threonine protein kinase